MHVESGQQAINLGRVEWSHTIRPPDTWHQQSSQLAPPMPLLLQYWCFIQYTKDTKVPRVACGRLYEPR